jgi:hypothetical protein
MNQPFNLYDLYHLYKFRMAAAGIIRDILSAVEQSDRDVLTEAIRRAWWDKDHQPSGNPVEKLLKNAEKNLRVFPVRFSGSLNSIPCPGDADGEPTGESVEDRVEKLRDLVGEFADPDALKQAVASNAQDLRVDWAQLCRWKLLPDIRKLLNTFPGTVGQSSVLKITDLAVEDPDIVRYKGVECTKPTKKCFLILKHLLTCRNHATSIGTLREKVWVSVDRNRGPVHPAQRASSPKTTRIADNHCDWGAVHSALRIVRLYFTANKIPYRITGSEVLGQITLKKPEPRGKARTNSEKPTKASKKQKSKSKQSPANNRAPKK